MLKQGDKVIFIGNNDDIIKYTSGEKNELIYGNYYIINYVIRDYCYVTKLFTPAYKLTAFIKPKQYIRKLKINKICLNQEIK